MKQILFLSTAVLLTGCLSSNVEYSPLDAPPKWNQYGNLTFETANLSTLHGWWKRFDDPTLTKLVDLALMDSPDRKIAAARISEARFLEKAARSSLFPQLDVTANVARQRPIEFSLNSSYQVGFDASYEVDLFGKNRNAVSAASSVRAGMEAAYDDASLSLVAEVIRTYINYRAYLKQIDIATNNIEIQTKTLDLIRAQKEAGEAPQLDVERAENLVNTTKSQIPSYMGLADNARLQLTVLTGHMPDDISNVLAQPGEIPGSNVAPVLAAPADVVSTRPDIIGATSNLQAAIHLTKSEAASLFPSLTLGGFFGLADNTLMASTTVWNVVAGSAVSLLNFGRIEARVDASRAVEEQAYQMYRKTVLAAVVEVETALNDFARLNEQRISLQKAFDNSDQALTLSQQLYREGEVSFLDVLDAQRTRNEADSALITSQAAQAESLVRLYKALGVY